MRRSSDLPITIAADGVRLAVRLTVRASADRLDGIARLADDTPALKASVTAPPADGRANAALLRLLAKELRLPARDLAIVGGRKGRSKLVHIAGDGAALAPLLAARFAALPAA